MGEAKRRQKLDPNFNNHEKSVKVKIEPNPSGNKWLCVAYILGVRIVISPHFKHEDAVSAGKQVEVNFNRFSVSQWRNFTLAGNRKTLSAAIATLDYSDDDEIIGVGIIDSKGKLTVERSMDERHLATKFVNQVAERAGKPKVFIDPTT